VSARTSRQWTSASTNAAGGKGGGKQDGIAGRQAAFQRGHPFGQRPRAAPDHRPGGGLAEPGQPIGPRAEDQQRAGSDAARLGGRRNIAAFVEQFLPKVERPQCGKPLVVRRPRNHREVALQGCGRIEQIRVDAFSEPEADQRAGRDDDRVVVAPVEGRQPLFDVAAEGDRFGVPNNPADGRIAPGSTRAHPPDSGEVRHTFAEDEGVTKIEVRQERGHRQFGPQTAGKVLGRVDGQVAAVGQQEAVEVAGEKIVRYGGIGQGRHAVAITRRLGPDELESHLRAQGRPKRGDGLGDLRAGQGAGPSGDPQGAAAHVRAPSATRRAAISARRRRSSKLTFARASTSPSET